MRRSRILGDGVAAALAASLVTAVPALGECGLQVNEFPSYTKVAPTADRVIIGTVLGDLTEPGETDGSFLLRVDEVLRGQAPDTLKVSGLKSGLPLHGSPACRGGAYLQARLGDVLAIAFDGRFAGQHDVNTVAWIEGRPGRDLVPGGQVLSLGQARRAAEALPPTDAALASGSDAVLPSFAWLMASLAGVLAAARFLLRRRRPA